MAPTDNLVSTTGGIRTNANRRTRTDSINDPLWAMTWRILASSKLDAGQAMARQAGDGETYEELVTLISLSCAQTADGTHRATLMPAKWKTPVLLRNRRGDGSRTGSRPESRAGSRSVPRSAWSGKTTLLGSWILCDVGARSGRLGEPRRALLTGNPGSSGPTCSTGLAWSGVPTAGVAAPAHPYWLDRRSCGTSRRRCTSGPNRSWWSWNDATSSATPPCAASSTSCCGTPAPPPLMVILTRGDSVPLPRYRMAGMVTEIGQLDPPRRWTRPSTFAQRGVAASAETLDILMTRTRGWMAGLVPPAWLCGARTSRSGAGRRGRRQRGPGRVLHGGGPQRGYAPAVRRDSCPDEHCRHVPAGLAERS